MRFYLLFVLAGIIAVSGCGQENNGNSSGNDIVIAFYNCENFFDTVHNPAKEDEEFTPEGKYHYTARIYTQKVHNIASVIQAMGMQGGPAILGMAEVENDQVLNDLISQPEIARHKYKYVWYDGPDPRGINVAMLYDPAQFRVMSAEPLHVDLTGVSGKSVTRDVLHVYGVLSGDTVDVFVNHWPSRRGGEEESGAKRNIAAKVVKDAINRVMNKKPAAKVIVMGDLNDNPTDESIAGVLGAKGTQSAVPASGLYDPWADIYKSGTGTEEYEHSWNLFDQIIISRAFLDNKTQGLQYDKAAIFKPDFIIDHYRGHEGEPHRSFAGTHWINGYSDHFPVILYMKKG